MEQMAEELETGSSQESPRRPAVTKRGNRRCYTITAFKNMKKRFLARKVTSFTGMTHFNSSQEVAPDSAA